MRIFTSNVRGLVRNWDAIKAIDISKFDILMFNEIWQIRNFENISLSDFKIANIYQRNAQRGGGVLTYIRDNIEFEKYKSRVTEGINESVAIALCNSIISVVYRPPSGNKNEFKEVYLTGFVIFIIRMCIYQVTLI